MELSGRLPSVCFSMCVTRVTAHRGLRAAADPFVDGGMDGWMDGGMDGGMDGWMDGGMDGWVADLQKQAIRAPLSSSTACPQPSYSVL